MSSTGEIPETPDPLFLPSTQLRGEAQAAPASSSGSAEYALLYEADSSIDLLARPSNFLPVRYTDARTEAHYLAFMEPNHYVLTLFAAAAAPFLMLRIASYFIPGRGGSNKFGSDTALWTTSLVCSLVVGALNIGWCILPQRRIARGEVNDPLQDSREDRFGKAVGRARHAEVLAFLMCQAMNIILVADHTPDDVVDRFPLAFVSFPLLIFTCRALWGLANGLMVLTMATIFRPPSHGKGVDGFLETLAIWIFIPTFLIGLLVHETHNRTRFETWVRLQQEHAYLQQIREATVKTLAIVLPIDDVNRLIRNEQVIDNREQATILVCMISDDLAWTAGLLPAVAAEMQDVVFSSFDELRQSTSGGARKMKLHGDSYVSSYGLRSQIDHDAYCPIGMLRLGNAQIKICQAYGVLADKAREVPGAPLAQYVVFVSVQIGIATGRCTGGMYGTETLFYDAVGPAMDTAVALAKAAAPMHMVIDSPTRDGCSGLCETENYVSLDLTAHIVTKVKRDGHRREAPQDGALSPIDDDASPSSTLAIDAADSDTEAHTHARLEFLNSRITDETKEAVEKLSGQLRDTNAVLASGYLSSFEFPRVVEHMYCDYYLELDRAYATLEVITLLVVVGWVIFSLVVQKGTSVAGLVGLLIGAFSGVGRFVVRMREDVNPIADYGVSMVQHTLTILSIAWWRYFELRGIASEDVGYLVAMINLCMFYSAVRLPWRIHFWGLVYIVLMFQVGNLALFLPSPTIIMYCLGQRFAEKARRMHFRDILDIELASLSTKHEILMQRQLMTMLLPGPIIEHAIRKSHGLCGCIHDLLGDVCMLQVRWGLPKQEGTPSSRTKMDTLIEHMQFLSLVVQAVEGCDTVSTLRMEGDVIVFAGPLRIASLSKKLQVPAALAPCRLRGPDPTVRAAGGLLRLLRMIIEKATPCRESVTAVLSAGDGLAVVFCQTQPLFDVVGPVARNCNAAFRAAPEGFMGMNPGFERTVAYGPTARSTLVDIADFGFAACSTTQRWSLRGAGLVRIVPLLAHVDDEAPTPPQ